MTSIKFALDKEVRRCLYEESMTFERLRLLALKLFPGLAGKNFQIYYLDDENDLVTLSSDDELNDAVKIMLPKSTTLKFTLQLEGDNIDDTNDYSKNMKIRRATSRNANASLPASLSPQEAMAASALLNQNGDSDSEDENPGGQPMHVNSTIDINHDAAITINERVPKRSRAEFVESGETSSGPAPEESGEVRRRQCYTLAEKLQLITEYTTTSSGNKKPMKQFALENGINQKTFSSWMKEYSDGKLTSIPNATESKRIRLRKADYPEIENLLIQFIDSYDPNQTVSWSLIRQNALKYAKELLSPEDLQDFKASDGWIQNFLRRNNIVLHRRVRAAPMATTSSPLVPRHGPAAIAVGNETISAIEGDSSSDDEIPK